MWYSLWTMIDPLHIEIPILSPHGQMYGGWIKAALARNPAAPWLARSTETWETKAGETQSVDLLWFRPRDLAAACGPAVHFTAMCKAIDPWLWHNAKQFRRHPVTGEHLPARESWAALDVSQIGRGL